LLPFFSWDKVEWEDKAGAWFHGFSVPVPGGAWHHLPDSYGPAVFHASVNPLVRIHPPREAWEPELKRIAEIYPL